MKTYKISRGRNIWLEQGVATHAHQDTGFCDKGEAFVFHTTTKKNAESILQTGFTPSAHLEVGGHPALGVRGRVMPAGVWASIRPVIPYDLDIWMPNICEEKWVIFLIRTPLALLAESEVWEPTWPLTQFCLSPKRINSFEILEPLKTPRFFLDQTIEAIFKNGLAHYHAPNPYLDALLNWKLAQPRLAVFSK